MAGKLKSADNVVSLEREYNRAMEAGLDALRAGKLLVFPTDTVYGIGGDARNESVVNAICKLKKRDAGKPLAVIMSGLGMIREWCEIHDEAARIMAENLPGPYTFILRLRPGKKLAGQSGKIGVRIPNHFFLRRLVLEFRAPVIATSANLSGKKDAARIEEIERGILKAAGIVIDSGKTEHGKPSTVVDLVERKVLRKGAGIFEFEKR